MSAGTGRLRTAVAGHMRMVYREGTVDKRAIEPWLRLVGQRPTHPFEVHPDDTVLDVGAHIGGFTILAATLVPDGSVLAVEPCRESYELLVRNVELNRLTNVKAERLALSDHRGKTRLHHSDNGSWGHTIIKPLGDEGESAPSNTLAGLLSQHSTASIDLVKFNCEGAEFPILLGASTETLRRLRQMVIFYHADLVEGLYALVDLEDRLESAGFELERYEAGASRGRLHVRLHR